MEPLVIFPNQTDKQQRRQKKTLRLQPLDQQGTSPPPIYSNIPPPSMNIKPLTLDPIPLTLEPIHLPSRLKNLSINIDDGFESLSMDNQLNTLIENFKTFNNDKEELLEVANDVYTSNYDNQDSVSKFIRNTIKKCGEPIAVHHRRQFDIEPNPKYSAFVYKDTQKNRAIKIYNYDCSDVADFAILQEIVWQKYAERISDICQMKIPAIIRYGRCTNKKLSKRFNRDCLFFIEMEWMNMPTLETQYSNINGNAEKCNSVAERINGVQQCMEDKGLYHNDFHHQNVLLDFNGTDRNNINVGVIDYGKSNMMPDKFENLDIYHCDKKHRLKTMRNGNSKSGGSKRNRRRSRRNRKN